MPTLAWVPERIVDLPKHRCHRLPVCLTKQLLHFVHRDHHTATSAAVCLEPGIQLHRAIHVAVPAPAQPHPSALVVSTLRHTDAQGGECLVHRLNLTVHANRLSGDQRRRNRHIRLRGPSGWHGWLPKRVLGICGHHKVRPRYVDGKHHARLAFRGNRGQVQCHHRRAQRRRLSRADLAGQDEPPVHLGEPAGQECCSPIGTEGEQS
mmetsp:Transcript_28295/g.91591  ORF Transcript_28295/g.91591 Transcript_28295/m.91591 type:complete len:207 (-) Transcript_28295:441-1061(-)